MSESGHTFPELSVVIPVFNGGVPLRLCLESLAKSSLRPKEVIVVDDGSSDSSAQVARDFGCRVLSTGGRKGPAEARGIGVRKAIGQVIVFVDADVLVHEETLQQFATLFAGSPSVAAAFGSYDCRPVHRNFLSQWKNLSHHFVHQNANREACTFWSGCGAIRREVFLDVGGFDLSYRGATIEDIELGYRLVSAGYQVVLAKEIQVAHAKRWDMRNLWKTDLLYRGIPWTRLILRTGTMPNDLNVSKAQRLSLLLSVLLLATMAAGAVMLPVGATIALALFVLVLTGQFWMSPYGFGRRGLNGIGVAVLTATAFGFSSAIHSRWLTAAIACTFLAGVCFRWRFRERASRMENALAAASLLFGLLGLVESIPLHPVPVLAACLALGVVAINDRFFVFFAQTRGVPFALAAFPFQILHHLVSAVSLVAGVILHYRQGSKAVARESALGRAASQSR